MPTVAELAELLELPRPERGGEREIHEVAPLDTAGPEALSFLANVRYREQLRGTRAGAVLVPPRFADEVPEGTVALPCDDPYGALARVMAWLHPPPAVEPGIHPTAVVAEDAEVDPSAHLGPYVIVESRARIGPRTFVGAHTFVGAESRIGADCRIYPRVTLYPQTEVGDRVILHAGVVLGADGFGFAPGPEGLRKVPQVGRVVVEDDVEIGANTTVDRATFGETRIERGVKLDNLIQVGHNVRIGAHTVIAAQTGIAGSVRIGAGCMIGGQVGIAGHIVVGDGCMIAAKSGVMRDLEPGSRVGGIPVLPQRQWLRVVAHLRRIARGGEDG